MNRYLLYLFTFYSLSIPCLAQSNDYMWQKSKNSNRSIAADIAPPEGYKRVKVDQDSFAKWLRHLPLKKHGLPVLLHDKRKKQNQQVHYAVIDIDTGTRDLQQCADAVIRLRAEYFYAKGHSKDIVFKFTSGHKASFRRWASGKRPVVKENKVTWRQIAKKDDSYANFREYLSTVFMYAGSFSLSRELAERKNIADIEIGDIFIHGGFPGHAVLVVDMAKHKLTGDKIFLLAQSYMPAQDIHILINPNTSTLSPWYSLPDGDIIHTPEWTFQQKELRYFK